MRPYLYLSTIVFCFFLFVSCNDSAMESKIEEIKPPAQGFNLADSDSLAIEIADAVMEAMGGRQAWDNTTYLKWNFFDARRHVWNKETNDIRMIGIRDTFDISMNLDSLFGQVEWNGKTLSDPDSLSKYLQMGKEMWINDSYWVFMPYKLKDSGVTLKYLGQDTMKTGTLAEVISLEFEKVAVTPQNKYHIYVDSTNLVKQWDFYTNSSDSVARFTTPWMDYKTYGDIQLSSSRGPGYDISELAVGDSLSVYFE